MLLFLLTIPIEDSLAISSEFSINRLIGMVAIGVWGILVLARQKIRHVHPFLLFVLLFIVWNLFSLFWTIDRDLTIARIKTYAQLGIMCFMIWDLVDSKRRLLIAIQTYVLGAYISVIGTIVNFLKGVEAYRYSGGRYVATGFNANDLAVILALGLPLAWYLFISTIENSGKRWIAVINLLYIPTAIFAIFLTGSRGGFITAMLSLCYILPTVGRMGRKVKIPFTILFIVLMIAAVIIIPDSTMQRIMSTFNSGETDYLGGRLQIFADAAGIIDKNPLLGVGSGAFKSATRFGTIAHNTFLSILSETGIVGFMLFCCILIFAGLEAIRHPRYEALLWITVMGMWAIGGSSVSWDYQKPTWLLLTLIVISGELLPIPSQKEQETPTNKIIHITLEDQGIIGSPDSPIKP